MKRKTAKELLAESFRELAQGREIDRITVQDIAKNCSYSVATFYRQFKDKFDLIAWDYARDVQKLLDQADGTPKDCRQSLSDAADYFDEQREYLQSRRGRSRQRGQGAACRKNEDRWMPGL